MESNLPHFLRAITMDTTKGSNSCDVVAPQTQNEAVALQYRECANTTPKKTVLEIADTFVRNHPIYDDWQDWKKVVKTYHSSYVKRIIEMVNKGHRNIQGEYTDVQGLIADFTYYNLSTLLGSGFYRVGVGETAEEFIEEMFKRPIMVPFDLYHFGCGCFEDLVLEKFPVKGCDLAFIHNTAHILSLIWCYVRMAKLRRHERRYFARLERVVLSMPPERLQYFDIRLITEFRSFVPFGRNLLKDLYERAYFDKPISELELAHRFAQLRHFVKEQSGASSQSFRDSRFAEMISLTEKLFRLDNSVMDYLTVPRQQGLFNVDHKHSWDMNDLDKLKNLITDVKDDFFKNFKEAIIDSAKTLLVMFIVASIVALLARIAIGTSAMIVYKLIHLICAFVCGTSEHSEINRCSKQQSGDDIEDMPILPRLIVKYLINVPTTFLGTLWNSRQTDLVMKRISYLGDTKLSNGIDVIQFWIKDMIKKTHRWFLKAYFGIDAPADLDGMDHAINTWNDEVDTLLKQYYSSEIAWTESTWSVVYNLYSRGLAFTRSKAYTQWKSDVWRVVAKLGNLLEEFKKHNKDGQSIRNPPVSLYLYGDTGVGKSALTYPLAVKILYKIFKREKNPISLKENWKNMIYMRSPEQEYWDGYENQFVTLFDDFNQQTDTASNPSTELFEIIRASNCFPYPLHMASIEQKAVTNFSSKIIIASSNMQKPRTESLNFPTALERRFDVAVRVSRKPNVQLNGQETFRDDIYDFVEYDMSTKQIKRSMTFDELVDLSVDRYFARSTFVESIDSYIENLFKEKPLPEMPEIKINTNMVLMREQVKEMAHQMTSHVEDNPFAIQQGGHTIGEMEDDEDQKYEAIMHNNAKTWYEKYHAEYQDCVEYPLDRVTKPVKCAFYNCMDALKDASDNLRLTWQDRYDWFGRLRERCSFLFNFKVPLTLILAGLSFIAVFYGIKRMFKDNRKIKTEKEVLEPIVARTRKLLNDVKSEGYNAPTIKTVRAESYTPVKVPVAKVESYSPVAVKTAKVEAKLEALEQGVKDLNASEILMKSARSNTYKMYTSLNGSAVGHVFFLRGRVAVMPRHYLAALEACLRKDPDSTVYFQSILLARCFECRIADFLKTAMTYDSPDEECGPVYSRDLMAVAIPTAITHTDAISFIASKSNFSHVDCIDVMLPVLVHNNMSPSKTDKPVLMLRFMEGRSALKKVPILHVGDDETPVKRLVRDAWEYNLDSCATECGAPLIVRNSKVAPGKICGIHIAGLEKTGEGYSTPFYREDAEEILNYFDPKWTIQQSIKTPLGEYPKEQCQVPQEAEFIRLGSLDKPIAQPSKTKVEPSLIHGKIREPRTKPCSLRPTVVDGKEFDPRSYRLGRLGNIPGPISADLIEASRDALVDEMSEVFKKTEDVKTSGVKAVYTFEEAVLGIEGEPFINSVKRDTSCGFPGVTRGKSRKNYFGNGMDYDLSSKDAQDLKQEVSDIVDDARLNIARDHYFIDTLKDERKPKHKAHKTRLFAAGPLAYLIVCKMYFNGVVALISHSRNKSHISVGTNPYSEDWGRIVSELLRKSDRMIAGDFEGFDASQHQLLLEAAGEVLIQLSKRFCGTTEEDAQVMRVLLVSLINSLHITGKEVYQWTHSLPSGHYLTAIINSIFVNLAFGCVWQLAFNEVSYYTARKFWKECGIVAYGDDHIVSIPAEYLKLINQMTLPELFSRIGLSYTMEDKDAVAESDSRPITSISYLKRGFSKDRVTGQWLAPLSLDTVLETPMWIHSCPDKKSQTIANIEWALKELALHPEETWKEWSPKLIALEAELGSFTMYRNQSDAKLACLSQTLEM